MLTLRPANIQDIPPLFVLADDFKHQAMDDYDAFDASVVEEIVSNAFTLVIDDKGYPVGAIWFDDQVDDLHATIHALIRPRYFRAAERQNLFSEALDLAFSNLKVGKILAYPMHTQKTALYLLRKHKFYEHKPWHKHTRQNGVKVDIVPFELKKNYWEKHRGLTQ